MEFVFGILLLLTLIVYAQQLARLFPIGMIFLRSLNDGRSHCPDEYTCKEDLSAGTEVLYRTLWKAANESIL